MVTSSLASFSLPLAAVGLVLAGSRLPSSAVALATDTLLFRGGMSMGFWCCIRATSWSSVRCHQGTNHAPCQISYSVAS